MGLVYRWSPVSWTMSGVELRRVGTRAKNAAESPTFAACDATTVTVKSALLLLKHSTIIEAELTDWRD
jgi:hypothetical protein